MWKWIAKLLKFNQDTSAGASGEILVSDEDYDFMVGTKPKLPDGLRDLKIAELRPGLLLLEDFDADLTVDQKAWDRTVQDIATATRIYRWASSYHNLAPVNHSPVRLHGDNLLLSDSHYSETHGPETDLSMWLERMGWTDDRSFDVQQANTEKPLEDGFFSCLRITVGKGTDPSDTLLAWKPSSGHSPSIHGALVEFVQQELSQPWGRGKCEEYLRACYRTATSVQLTHPVFALIDFPVFDMGMLSTTFAGAVLSRQELRFWSRPTYFHK
ncbi:MAG: hypothetical protein NTV29_03750 [Planctomycetota bacterium]|nr:hypothetical protein [Planctomycetota bacterium]